MKKIKSQQLGTISKNRNNSADLRTFAQNKKINLQIMSDAKQAQVKTQDLPKKKDQGHQFMFMAKIQIRNTDMCALINIVNLAFSNTSALEQNLHYFYLFLENSNSFKRMPIK
ncbi:unnamed protein product (macronuclear) [Paramecium tetraurelia]|nr:uncharacterized protein GSPATT00039805001 [Paramecium tetraurelia]CAK87302.1 unnamed protein product [Paramecium tetraurelia]|eukprot:XP_001454699.1 hypothetical protein (macronuclear) [Paramecium tetraurelia strain d4-2]